MKLIYTILLTLAVTTFHAQNFYDMDVVQTIEVTFAQSTWDQEMDAAYAADAGYIMAQSVVINGVTFDSVGVKYKGNSSYSANQVKNPWHIELDTYKDQEYDGYTDIKLANGNKDPSMIRDVLAYSVIRQYMEAPEANFANLYVNGNLIGLYANTESISKKFMNSRFGSKENTRFKCSPPEGAGPQTNDFPNLVYLGQDSTGYYAGYELKSDAGWQELIDLCDTLVNHTSEIEQILDVNRALWMLAFDNVIVNLDSYIGAFAQNYYLYRSDYGQFLPVVWDLNESFGVFSMTGSGNLNGTTAKQQMTPFLHENDNDHPLVSELLSVPMYKRIYLAHMKTILMENFDNDSYYTTGLALQATIDDDVQADGNKFYTYQNFIDNLTTDIGGGGGPGGGNSAPGITNLMDGRSSYLLGLSQFTAAEPSISDINVSNTLPVLAEQITITANVADATTVYLGYRNAANTAPFTRIEMFDDGTHGDGGANDGVYGAEITIDALTTDYFIYAENDDIGMFSPRRAEFEFYNIQSINPSSSDVVVNEFMASNDETVFDQDGEYDDWIELYNTNETDAIDLSGYFLTDDATDLSKWAIPDGTTIEANGYLIIWADEDLDQAGLHADFKLSSSGESVYLVYPVDTTIADGVDYPEQTTDISYARIPNGIGNFALASPTFNANNDSLVDCTAFGGDMDNDGICADDDCDDTDASVGAKQPEGTACDDGDATTQNDVILADGCTCVGQAVTTSDVVINEFMASNDTTMADQDGDFDDWIELYNNGTEAIDLSGYFLTDDGSELTKWSFPAGTSIEPNGYLIIWADEDLDQAGLHADFKLSASGESVILVEPTDTSIIDLVDYPEQSTDISYGRFVNGVGDFQLMPPTFNAENTIFSSVDDTVLANDDLLIYPNPADDYFFLEYSTEKIDEKIVTIYNITGAIIYQNTVLDKELIDTSNWAAGMYVIQSEGAILKLMITK